MLHRRNRIYNTKPMGMVEQKKPRQKIWVVMGNDYPDAVFSTEERAQAYCDSLKEKNLAKYQSSRIYWRHYEFELDAK